MLGSRIKFQESKCLIASRMNAEYTELAWSSLLLDNNLIAALSSLDMKPSAIHPPSFNWIELKCGVHEWNFFLGYLKNHSIFAEIEYTKGYSRMLL